MRMRRAFLLMAGLVALSACDKNDGGQGRASQLTLKANIGLDMSRVGGFVLGLSSAGSPLMSGAHTPGHVSTLYALDADGTLTETLFFEEDDGGVDSQQMRQAPRAIHNLAKYVLFDFGEMTLRGGDVDSRQCNSLLLRKSDGALYCGGSAQLNGRLFAAPDGDSVFVAGQNAVLTRLDFSDPSGPTSTELATQARVMGMVVNAKGEALVSMFDVDSAARFTRVYRPGGGIQNIVNSAAFCVLPGRIGEDDDFYYLGDVFAAPGGGPQMPVTKVARAQSGTFSGSDAGVYAGGGATCQLGLRTQGSLYVALTGGGAKQEPPRIVEIINRSGAPIVHLVSGMDSVIDAKGAGSVIFIRATDAAGNGAIVRFETSDGGMQTVLPPGEFSLSAIDVSSLGELSFSGVRNADGKRVLGVVAPGGSTYTIQSEAAPTVTVFTRIN